MENKDAKKKEILDLLKRDVISIDEAVEMLNKINEPSIVKWAREQEVNKKVTLKEKIDEIVVNTVGDMNMSAVIRIMQDMKWTYGIGNDEKLATPEEIIKCAQKTVRSTLEHLIKNQIEENYPSATTGTGGFECHAWVDDDDWDNIQIDLKFIPYTGYGEGHLDELIALKKQEQ